MARARFSASAVPQATFGLTKKRRKTKREVPVNPDALPLSQAARLLRVSQMSNGHNPSDIQALEIGAPGSAYSVTLETRHSPSLPPLRGSAHLPLSPQKSKASVAVFADPSDTVALSCGADHIGSIDLLERVLKGEVVPTKVICTPALLPALTQRAAKFLGPKGLMPSPRRGSVVESSALRGKVEEVTGAMDWRADKLGVVRARKLTHCGTYKNGGVDAKLWRACHSRCRRSRTMSEASSKQCRPQQRTLR